MATLLSQPYSIGNYNNIVKKLQEITSSNSKNADKNNNSKTCVIETVRNISDDDKQKVKYRLLEEFCVILLNLHEYVNIFSLPPFNLSEQVGIIRSLIDNFSFEYTKENINFLDMLTILITNLCEEIKELCEKLLSETYDDITMVNIKDSIFLSLRFQVEPRQNGIFIDFDSILANVLVQTLTKLDSLVNNEFPKYFNFGKIQKINDMIFLINEIRRKSENRKLKKKINNLINKIQQLLIRCGTKKKENFDVKFKEFLAKFEILKAENELKEAENEVKDSFLALLDTIKKEIPTTKCVDFYGMDDVSKYDFYDLLKKIGVVLGELNNTFKYEIEQKIREVKPFLSTSDRALSYVRKLKPTEESTEAVEKPVNKIYGLINELDDLIWNCIPFYSNFFKNFKTLKKINTSNITQIDIANFDEVWKSVAELKDSYKCSVNFSKKEFSKKELYTKLKEIGKLLLSNISEPAKETVSVPVPGRKQERIKAEVFQPSAVVV